MTLFCSLETPFLVPPLPQVAVLRQERGSGGGGSHSQVRKNKQKRPFQNGQNHEILDESTVAVCMRVRVRYGCKRYKKANYK